MVGTSKSALLAVVVALSWAVDIATCDLIDDALGLDDASLSNDFADDLSALPAGADKESSLLSEPEFEDATYAPANDAGDSEALTAEGDEEENITSDKAAFDSDISDYVPVADTLDEAVEAAEALEEAISTPVEENAADLDSDVDEDIDEQLGGPAAGALIIGVGDVGEVGEQDWKEEVRNLAEEIQKAFQDITEAVSDIVSDLAYVNLTCTDHPVDNSDEAFAEMNDCTRTLKKVCDCEGEERVGRCLKACWLDKEKMATVVSEGCELLQCHLSRLEECTECFDTVNVKVDVDCVAECQANRKEELIIRGCPSLQCDKALHDTCFDQCNGQCKSVCKDSTVISSLSTDGIELSQEESVDDFAEFHEIYRRQGESLFDSPSAEDDDEDDDAEASSEATLAEMAGKDRDCRHCHLGCMSKCRCDNKDLLNTQGCEIGE